MTDKNPTASDNPDGKQPEQTGPGTTVQGAGGQGASAPDLDPQTRPAGGSTPGQQGGTVSEPSANPSPPETDATTDPETHDSPQLPPDHGQDRH